MIAQVTTSETVAMSIMALCMIFCILALASVAGIMAWIIYKRVGSRDDQVSMDIAERLVSSWNAGYDTHDRIIHNADGRAQLEVGRRRSNQHWSPAVDDANQAEPDYRTVAEFGTDPVADPIMPEMSRI